MARESDYSKFGRDDDAVSNQKLAQNKLNREDMTTLDLAQLTMNSERTIRNLLSKICDRHSGKLSIDMFKKNGNYLFDRNWNGILAVLINLASTSSFDGRSDKFGLKGYFENKESIASSIDRYLSEFDKLNIRQHPAIQQFELETELYKNINIKIERITGTIGMMPPALRFSTLAGIDRALNPIPSNMASKYSAYLVENAINKKKARASGEEYVDLNQYSEEIEDYLVSLLKQKMSGMYNNEVVYTQEELARATLKLLVQGSLTDCNVRELRELAETTRTGILEEDRIKSALKKVTAVLEKDDPYEGVLLSWIENTLVMISCTESCGLKENKLGEELVRRTVTQDVIRGLNNFCNYKE